MTEFLFRGTESVPLYSWIGRDLCVPSRPWLVEWVDKSHEPHWGRVDVLFLTDLLRQPVLVWRAGIGGRVTNRELWVRSRTGW